MMLFVGLCLYVYDNIADVLRGLFARAPIGKTLKERYPPNKDAFVTHYSSIELTEDWFVKSPRNYGHAATEAARQRSDSTGRNQVE